MNKLFATTATAALAIAGTYSFAAWHAISSTDFESITTQYTAPRHLQESPSVKSIVNPKNHVSMADVRSTLVRVPRELSDEVILARYVQGFFGGYIFAPESIILKTLHLDFTKFIALKEVETPSKTWSQSHISKTKLPPLHSMLFGAFQVVDCSIDNSQKDLDPPKSHSYIDFAYGSDDGILAGVHRFSIYRNGGGDDGAIQVEFSSLSVNPRGNSSWPALLERFHRIYAMLLFREAVSNIVRGG